MPSGARTPPGPLTQEVTALLREHIARQQWSYVAVSEAAKVPTSTFNDLINGRKPIDIEQLDRIAWAVGLQLEDLMRRAEDNVSNRQTSKGWKADRLTKPKPGS